MLGYIIFEGAEEDRNLNTLVDMISGMEVKEDDEDFLNAVDYMFKGLEQRKPNCFAVKQYVEGLQSMISAGSFIGMLAVAFVGGLIGTLVGRLMLKKHFEKAGIV